MDKPFCMSTIFLEVMASGQLSFVGLGLYDENDISLKGLHELQHCDRVFAEFYTSKLTGAPVSSLEKMSGKSIRVLSREETEHAEMILSYARKEHVVLLVCGDPMMATTHVDLRIRAHDLGIPIRIIHGSSITSAVPGLLGLQNYKFGRTTTLVFPEKNYFPTSPYTIVEGNLERGLHTLVLLDIQAENNRYMTANEGISLLLDMRNQLGRGRFDEESVICVVARAGSDAPLLRADRACVLQAEEFGSPLHSLVVPGDLHFLELEALMKIAGLPEAIGKKLQKV